MVNIFIDMDGVLARFHPNTVKHMYTKGFFLNRPPMNSNIEMVKQLLKDSSYNVFILTSLLAENPYIVDEKTKWLNKYIPEIKKENVLMVKQGTPKSEYIFSLKLNNKKCFLIDDFTENLIKWEKDGLVGIKMYNNLNGTKGRWRLLGRPFLKHNDRVMSKVNKIKRLISN